MRKYLFIEHIVLPRGALLHVLCRIRAQELRFRLRLFTIKCCESCFVHTQTSEVSQCSFNNVFTGHISLINCSQTKPV